MVSFASSEEALPCANCLRPEAVLAGQNRALELIAGNAPLPRVLDYLARFIEAQTSGLFCTVLVLEGDRLRLSAAPTLPRAYGQAISDIPFGLSVGSCGTAACTGMRVVADDIASDPHWAPFPEVVSLALAHGLRACWSTPVRSADGKVLGTIAIYYTTPSPPRPSDLHLVEIATHIAGIAIERHRADRALEERARRLAETDQRKDEFLALLAHELRNPLAAVVTALDLMRTRQGDAAALERYRQILERQVRQLGRLVDDLLDVSRITRGKIVLQRERTTLGAALACAVESARPLLDRRRHELAVVVPDEPLALCADPVRLAQILANLLHNAAKYTEPGGHIEVRAAREAEAVVVTVRDDGIGIPAEMRERIFELFVQTDAARAEAQGGLGIGLTLVQRLVEMHGGSVEVASDGPGRGSTFTVRLPAATDEREAPAPVSAPLPVLPRRVLVVDDNVDAATSLADALRDAGHEVRVENDGVSALALAAAWTPDVALVDIGMPGMDGYEVARRLRAAHEPLRLVALTGYGQERDQQRAHTAGFDAHLVKPADLRRIAAALAG